MLSISEIDLVGEIVVKVDVGFAGEGVLGDRLERLFHVDRLFGRRLEVRNVALCVAPLLGALYRNLSEGGRKKMRERERERGRR